MPPIFPLLICLLSPQLDERVPVSDPWQGVVATVDGRPIPTDEFTGWMLATYGPVVLQEFVDRVAIARACEKRGIVLDERKVDQAYQDEYRTIVEQRFRGEESGFDRELEAGGHSRSTYTFQRKSALREQLQLDEFALRIRDISEARLRADFVERLGEPAERIDVRLIFVQRRALLSDRTRLELSSNPQSAAEAVELTRIYTEQARARLVAGEEFATVARETSDDPSAADGGIITMYCSLDYPSEVTAQLAQMKGPGSLSPLVPVAAGFYVVELVERRRVTFEEVRDALADRILAAPVSMDERMEARRIALESIEIARVTPEVR